MSGEIGEDPTAVSPEEILARLKKISDTGAAGKFVIDFRVAAQFAHVNKLFLSRKKGPYADVCFLQKACGGHWCRRGKADMIFRGFSGLKGAELLDEIGGIVDELLKLLDEKLHADPVVPGMYVSSLLRRSPV